MAELQLLSLLGKLLERYGMEVVLLIIAIIFYFRNKASNKKIDDFEIASEEKIKLLEKRLEKVENKQLSSKDLTLAIIEGLDPIQEKMSESFRRLHKKLDNYVPTAECKALREGIYNGRKRSSD